MMYVGSSAKVSLTTRLSSEMRGLQKLMLWKKAVLDVPCLSFAEELIAMYPDAKVILSEMPADGQYRADTH